MTELPGDSSLDIPREVEAAEKRIRPHIRQTPLEHSIWLSELIDGEVYLKLENLQKTGSFKLRGAANKLLSLSKTEQQRGIVTASTGNHGSAVAYLLRELGLSGTIYVPETISAAKLGALKMYGAKLEMHGTDGVEAELLARRQAEAAGQVFVSPYNDIKIIGGQGTIGRELEQQIGHFDAILAPVGGGGLMAGVAGYLKSTLDDLEVVGCQPQNSAVMAASVEAGHVVELESRPTLADGSAGGVELDTITYPLCRDLVDRFVLLEEGEIERAIRSILEKHQLLIEGAAALTVAALRNEAARYEGRRVVLILSGAKISLEALQRVLAHTGD